MARRKQLSIGLGFAGLLCIAVLAGCGSPADESSEIVATVNGESISRWELERDLAIRSRSGGDRPIDDAFVREQLDLMIHRKLLLQEAMRRRLAERETFRATIQSFWEQTLITELMAELNTEFDGEALTRWLEGIRQDADIVVHEEQLVR